MHLIRRLVLLAVVLASLGAEAVAQTSKSASVGINIRVVPTVQVDLPNGANFTLRVPNTPHCSPKRDRDWDYWKSRNDRSHTRGKNDRDDWDNWRDDDWNRWGDNNWWDDWDDWNGRDWQRHDWYERCKRWLSDWYWPVIKPVRIPFKVTGNAIASVQVKPHQTLRIKTGRYLGKATYGTNYLGYDTIVHFPAPKSDYYWQSGWEFYDDWLDWRRWSGFGSMPSWSKWAKLPAITNGANIGNTLVTPPLTANMVQRGGKAYGVVYIVSRRDFTTDGKKARPGNYTGTIVLTVTADNI